MSEDKHDARKQLEINAKKKDILEVAQAFGMTLNKDGKGYQGEFQGHDTFTIYPGTNSFLWHGRGLNNKMSVADLVSVLKFGATTKEEIDAAFPKSVVELNRLELPEFVPGKIPEQKTFKYFYEESQNMELAIAYLEERGISRETIDYFIDRGMLAQAEWRTELEDGTYFYEPVVIFKNLDHKGRVIGGSAQGIEAHPEIRGHKHKSGHLKRVLPNSGSNSGLKVTIGTPKNVVPIEAPIDLLSYFDLNKNKLKDTILVAADGYKPDAYWKAMAEVMVSSPLISEEIIKDKDWAVKHLIEHPDQLHQNYQTLISISDEKTGQFIFAFDNDEQGQSFIEKFKNDNHDTVQKVRVEVPSQGKDWNEQLQLQNKTTEPSVSDLGFIEPPLEEEQSFPSPEETYPEPPNKQEFENYSQTKFIKIFESKVDGNGQPYHISKIFELDKLTSISDLKTDLSGRVSLDVVGVLTLDKKKSELQEAKYSIDKHLKNNRFVLTYNFSKENILRPSQEEIQKFKKEKGKFETVNIKETSKSKSTPSENNKNYANNVSSQTTTIKEKSAKSLQEAVTNRDTKSVNTALKEELSNYKSSEKFRDFLNVLSTMPELSEKNIRLILAQNPQARVVKEFNTWSNDFHRKIKFQSKAIKIFVPSPQPQWDKNENMKLDKHKQPIISESKEQLVSVFDIGQTENFSHTNTLDKDILPEVSPTIPREEAIKIFQELSKLSKISIHFTPIPFEKDDKSIHFEHSWYSKEREVLYIQKGLSPEKALQALVQELAYQKYFNPSLSPELQKLEVLSMSYVMLRQVGLETELNIQSLTSSLTAPQITQTLEHLQVNTEGFSEEVQQLFKSKVQSKNKTMTPKDKMEKLSFKERMTMAKQSHNDQVKEKSSSKKVQGVHQAKAI
ncbi:toprim domain-containing protein (plasmid) [Lactococcus formosensis]|uniref:toprim domain-containing protein n=1 Tax=Lactococcus formosensis TaxID=1281486 RepID=UPI0030D02BDB